MKLLKQGLRVLVVLLFLTLAVFGIGLPANILSANREPFRDQAIRTEIVDKREEDEEEDEVKQ